MSKLENKYSDTRLDPSESAFDEIIGQPDMKAVDDQGDAIARDSTTAKLRGSENNPDTDDSNDSDKNGQQESSQEPENKYYHASQQSTSNNASRKKFWIAAGAGGGAIGALIGGLITLAPLKVPGMLKMVTEQTTQRLEQATERRAKTVLGRAILTKFGSHSGIVVTGGGAVSSLIASMRTANFEKKLAAKGLVIQESGKDGVKLFVDGKPLENGRTLRTAPEVLKAMDGNPLTNKMIKQLVKEEIPSWRWMKKAKFAKWLRWKYNIPRYGILNSDNPDSEEKIAEMDDQRRQASNQRTVTYFTEILACIMSGSCDKVEGTSDPSKKADQAQATVTEVKEAADLSTSEKSMTKTLLEKFSSKTIPIVGWIDLLATLDHFAYVSVGEEDIFGKISAYYKGAAYAAIYADWAGYGSQIELGAMDPEYVGVLANQLNDAEKAQLFQAVQGNPTAGIPIEVRVDEDKPSSVKKLFDNIVNSPAGFGSKYIGHPVLNVYYETIGGGGFLGWASGAIGDIIGPLFAGIGNVIGNLTPDKVKELALESVSALGPFILKTFGLTIDAMDKGANLLNNIFAGGVVSANQYGKEIGLRKLTPAQTYQQNQTVAMERAQYRTEKGLAYALFSSEYSNSLTSQLAVSLPTSPESTISSIGSLVASTPQKLLSTFFPLTKAASDTTYEEIVGVNPYGATEADLNQPLAEETITGDECPEVAEGEYDNCSIDKTVAEAMLCEFDPESFDCNETEATLETPLDSGPTNIRVATFNIQKSDVGNWQDRLSRSVKALTDKQISIAGLQEARPEQQRLFKQANYGGTIYDMYPSKVTTGRLPDENPDSVVIWDKSKFELVSGRQKSIKYEGDARKVNIVKLRYIQGGAKGPELYVLNTHDPIDDRSVSPGGPQNRKDNNELYYQTIKNELTDAPVIFTGDFNSKMTVEASLNKPLGNLRENLAYCILTRDNLLTHVSDSQQGKTGCPSQQDVLGRNDVDHIFISPSLNASGYGVVKRGLNGGDHEMVYSDIKIPGIESTAVSSPGGWSWPLGKQAWEKYRSAFVKEHDVGGGYYDQGNSSIDISWGPTDTGAPIYSMLDGVVKKQPLGRSSYGCVGTPNVSNNGGMEVVSTINGKTVEITYAHAYAPEYNAGQSVKSGEQILKLGNVGNSCGSHLHMNIAYGGRSVCPQDVFIALSKGQEPNLEELVGKATPRCEGR